MPVQSHLLPELSRKKKKQTNNKTIKGGVSLKYASK